MKLPEVCETVYPLKVEVSDTHWWHISGEKVIARDADCEAAKEYIERHNPALKNCVYRETDEARERGRQELDRRIG